MKKLLKDKKAITLIALVITIVILVILAAVTISLTVGNEGLIARAKKAAQDYANSQDKDKQDINDLYGELLVATDGTIQNLTMDKLEEIIDKRINYSNTQNNNLTTINIVSPSEDNLKKWVQIAEYPDGYNFNNCYINGGFINTFIDNKQCNYPIIYPFSTTWASCVRTTESGIDMYITTNYLCEKTGKIVLSKY